MGGGETWTATSARRVSDPPPLRANKRVTSKLRSDAALAEARKGKKKAVKRGSPAPTAAGTAKPAAWSAARGSEWESEEKAPPRATKKAKKVPATSALETRAANREEGFDLAEFMASFKLGTASTTPPFAEAAVSATFPPAVP
ncbi:hypothetical protein V7S43_002273 [Phytophthora oleae]|uniref:Uncharacterized protein n=1 Tax=Phytophthora oleae TaxID=2107226 RepID=A0ABD3G326_9STRA